MFSIRTHWQGCDQLLSPERQSSQNLGEHSVLERYNTETSILAEESPLYMDV